MKQNFIKGIKKLFGSTHYSGITSDSFSSFGTKHCWFDEKEGALIIHVDPELLQSQGYDEIHKIIPMGKKYYNKIALIFDDWVYLEEFLFSLNEGIGTELVEQKERGGLNEKKLIPVDRKEDFRIYYYTFKFHGVQYEAQNIDNAYAILLIN